MATEVVTTTTTTTETVVVKTEEVVEEIKSNENHIDETKPQDGQEEEKPEIVEEPPKPEENGIAQAKVRLDQHPPWSKIPSPLPECLAVETYLRMLKIPYESSYKGTPDWSKLPVVAYEGATQRQDIYDFLNAKFGVDPDSHLDEEKKAVSRAFQLMVGESTAWSLVQYRWIDNYAETKKYYKGKGLLVPDVRTKMEKNKCSKCLEAHTIGKHTKEQIYSIAEKDLRALSTFLGDKDYFMGDEPSAIDCTMFGLLANFVYAADTENSPQRKLIEDELTNLKDFCGRIKNDYWLDWGEVCSDEVVEEMKPKKPSLRRKKRTKSATDAKGEAESGEKAEDKKEENGEKAEDGEGAEAAAEGEPAAEENKEEEGAKEGEEAKEEGGEKNEDEAPANNGEEASEPPAQDAE